LEQVVDFVALLEDFVEVVLADDIAKAGERELVDGGGGIPHGDDGLRGIDDAVPEDGIHADGDAVAGDRLLLLGGNGEGANIDGDPALEAERDDVADPRAAHAGEAPEAKDDAALVLLRDPDAGEENGNQDE